jgi:hypothetical protein
LADCGEFRVKGTDNRRWPFAFGLALADDGEGRRGTLFSAPSTIGEASTALLVGNAAAGRDQEVRSMRGR